MPKSVSRLLPNVLISTTPLVGAVHCHQTELIGSELAGLPVRFGMTGSPTSPVAPTLLPVTVAFVPVRTVAFANRSLPDGTVRSSRARSVGRKRGVYSVFAVVGRRVSRVRMFRVNQLMAVLPLALPVVWDEGHAWGTRSAVLGVELGGGLRRSPCREDGGNPTRFGRATPVGACATRGGTIGFQMFNPRSTRQKNGRIGYRVRHVQRTEERPAFGGRELRGAARIGCLCLESRLDPALWRENKTARFRNFRRARGRFGSRFSWCRSSRSVRGLRRGRHSQTRRERRPESRRDNARRHPLMTPIGRIRATLRDKSAW
jgi:hypothetical protein